MAGRRSVTTAAWKRRELLGGPEGMRAGVIVKRDRLVASVLGRCGDAGAAVVCAPDGFGKSALLMQCVSEVQDRRGTGAARLLDASRLPKDEIWGRLEALARGEAPDAEGTLPGPAGCGEAAPEETGDGRDGSALSVDFTGDDGSRARETPTEREGADGERPVEAPVFVAIDNLPHFSRREAEEGLGVIRRLASEGCRILVACEPSNRPFTGDLEGIGAVRAAELLVQPAEYPEWAAAFSISPKLDVYGLTQGVPALVAQLQAATERQQDDEVVETAAAALYWSALEGMRAERDALHRLACTIVLLGTGSLEDFKRCGVRTAAASLRRLRRDYPIFGLGGEGSMFSCLARGSSAMSELRREIARKRPAFASRAARVLMKTGRVDDAVELGRLALDAPEALSLISQFPLQFALAGHGGFVREALGDAANVSVSGMEAGTLLAAYAAALTMGDYRAARGAAAQLRKHADEIPQQVDASDWDCARALAGVWGSVSGIELPEVEHTGGQKTLAARRLRAHTDLYRDLLAGSGSVSWRKAEGLLRRRDGSNAIDVPWLLLEADRCLDAALHGDGAEEGRVTLLEKAAHALVKRRAEPVADRIRLAAGICRMLAGRPLVDERAFSEAGTMAVRESDQPTQLLCLGAEGWQALSVGQAVNAQFRGQQVAKLADQDRTFLLSWGRLLERTAHLRGTSQVVIREEAEGIDLSDESCDAVTAWTTALHLSAARFDAELSAWLSAHKGVLFDAGIRPLARHAMAMLGGRADSIRHLMPRDLARRYAYPHDKPEASDSLFEVVLGKRDAEIGQVVINLFGGLYIERNGHAVSDSAWRRKKASVLAARLVLSMGSFVSRRTLIDELWPDTTYARGRENMYVTLSALRAALKQKAGGPQYVITQGDGIALNGEFVVSDVLRFEQLAREILLRDPKATSQQTIEACLKLEQLYRGPLFVPDRGNPAYFLKLRRAFLTRFVDCMMVGVDLALDAENGTCASWMVDAALRQAPTRENVIRHAMSVFDLCGRHREIVELYNSHLHYLQREVNDVPEPETRAMYERIIGRKQRVAVM